MKKLLLTLTALFFSFGAFAQGVHVTKLSPSTDKTLEVTNLKKPLVVLEYELERLSIIASNGNSVLSQIDLELINSFEVLKGESAKYAFGEKAKDGVILLQLKKNRAAKKLFQAFKTDANEGLLINTEKKSDVNKRRGFPVNKTGEFSINNSQEPAQLSELRPSNYEPAAIFIMSLNGKERLIKNPADLEKLGNDALKSVDVLKDGFSKTKYKSNGKDVIVATFKSSKETKRFFKKLKKIKNK